MRKLRQRRACAARVTTISSALVLLAGCASAAKDPNFHFSDDTCSPACGTDERCVDQECVQTDGDGGIIDQDGNSGCELETGNPGECWPPALPATVMPAALPDSYTYASRANFANGSVASPITTRVDVFLLGAHGSLRHKMWNGSAWSSWATRAHDIVDEPVVATWGPQRLDTFARNEDGGITHIAWDGDDWSDDEDLGGKFSIGPVVTTRGANRLDLFAVGDDGSIFHRPWDGTRWNAWQDLGHPDGVVFLLRPAVIDWGKNRLDIFAVGNDQALWHNFWSGGTAWSGWESLGGASSSPPAAVALDATHINVFTRGTSDQLQQVFFANTWQPWQDLEGMITTGPVVTSRPGLINVFARGTDLQLFHRGWTGSAWTNWEPQGSELNTSIQAISPGDDSVHVFARNTDMNMYQRAWNGSAWVEWEDLGQ